MAQPIFLDGKTISLTEWGLAEGGIAHTEAGTDVL